MIQVTDLLTVSMMLGITAQVKEAGVAWDKGEKKSACNVFFLMLYLWCVELALSEIERVSILFQTWRS